ncbi:MAG: SGNH/GDSL hydrolase family protein [Sphingobacteriaceae bacterium]|nr:SGNH/GDSL hydrolase family protein [Sphingobacteriaceae bacterium]
MKLFLLPLLLIVTSCKKDEKVTYAESVSYPKPSAPALITKNFSYLALGDSYTVGQNVSASGTFPAQLSTSPQTGTHKWVAAPFTVIAQTGWTTDELISAIKNKNLSGTFDIVTLLIGVNNQYRGYSTTTYRTEFIELLNIAIAYAGGDKTRMFVLSIPDWGVTPYAQHQDKAKIAKEIDAFNAINKQETENAGISYTDITQISRMAEGNRSLIADDGLHPSAGMYKLWVDKLAPKVIARLQN